MKAKYGFEVYIEPGKAIVDNAGYLLTKVIDTFVSGGKHIALLKQSSYQNYREQWTV
ncbi:MAG: hypothetical protein KAT04_11155 [Methylococcales bacterium]|nr:hypothetical protein [Methylococcales bacterium]